jgi:putative ABC transport system permease protein
VSTDGRDCRVADCPSAAVYAVDAGYFAALRLPVRLGRPFDPARPADRDAVIVSEHAAAIFWPGRDPIGQVFREGPTARSREVVGVVADATHRSFGEPARPYIYQPLDADDFGAPFTMIVRTSRDPRALIDPVRALIHTRDPRLPPSAIETMRDRMALPLWVPWTEAGFFGICAALATLLSTVGLFGVIHAVVSQRTREFGVRAAMGASARDLRRLVLGDALRLVVPGVVVGLAAATAAAAVTRGVMSGPAPLEPAAWVAAAGLQAFVALAASWAPAGRAARVDPVRVLRV